MLKDGLLGETLELTTVIMRDVTLEVTVMAENVAVTRTRRAAVGLWALLPADLAFRNLVQTHVTY